MGTFVNLLDLVAGNPEADIATAASGFLRLQGLNPATVFNKSIRQAFPFILGGVNSGLSANAIQNALSSAGLGVNRANLLTVVGILRENFGYPAWLRGTAANRYPPAELFKPGWPSQSEQYLITVKVTTKDPLTGKTYESFNSFSSPTLMSNEDVAGQVDALNPSNYPGVMAPEIIGWDYETIRVSPTMG